MPSGASVATMAICSLIPPLHILRILSISTARMMPMQKSVLKSAKMPTSVSTRSTLWKQHRMPSAQRVRSISSARSMAEPMNLKILKSAAISSELLLSAMSKVSTSPFPEPPLRRFSAAAAAAVQKLPVRSIWL